MNIVHLIDYFQPAVGYQETFLAKAQANAGYDVTVVTSDRFAPFPGYEKTYRPLLGNRITGPGSRKESGINTVRLKTLEISGTGLVYLYGLSSVLDGIKPDLVHCHGVYSLTSYLISRIRGKSKFKLVYDTHAAAFNTDFSRSKARRLYHALYRAFMAPSILGNADLVFAVGQAEKDFICKDLGIKHAKIPVIGFGADTELFKYSAASRIRVRKLLGINKESVVVIFTGKISQNKDVHILAKALGRFEKNKPLFMLVGAGPEEYLREIRTLAKGIKLIHIPFVENRELSRYYSAADLAVWPGDSTVAILEAMSTGLPVVLPLWYGNKDLDKSGGVTRFRRGDAKDLFRKMRGLEYNRELMHKQGAFNRKFIVDNYSWENISDKIILSVN